MLYIHTYTYISFHQCMKIQVVFSSDILLCDIWLSWVNQRHLFTVEADFTNNALYELRRILFSIYKYSCRLCWHLGMSISFFPLDSYFFSLSMAIFSIATVSEAVLSHVEKRVISINTVIEITFGNFYVLQKD